MLFDILRFSTFHSLQGKRKGKRVCYIESDTLKQTHPVAVNSTPATEDEAAMTIPLIIRVHDFHLSGI